MKKLGCLFLCLMGSQFFAMHDMPKTEQVVIGSLSLKNPSTPTGLLSQNNSSDSLFDSYPSTPMTDADCPVRYTPSPRKKPAGRCVVSPKKRAPYEHGN